MERVLLVDVNLDKKGILAVQYVNREHLSITVLVIATVTTSQVIVNTVHVLLVDVNVDIKAVTVVQNAIVVDMVTIAINHVTGVYLIPVKKNLVCVQIHLDVNLEDNLDS